MVYESDFTPILKISRFHVLKQAFESRFLFVEGVEVDF